MNKCSKCRHNYEPTKSFDIGALSSTVADSMARHKTFQSAADNLNNNGTKTISGKNWTAQNLVNFAMAYLGYEPRRNGITTEQFKIVSKGIVHYSKCCHSFMGLLNILNEHRCETVRGLPWTYENLYKFILTHNKKLFKKLSKG